MALENGPDYSLCPATGQRGESPSSGARWTRAMGAWGRPSDSAHAVEGTTSFRMISTSLLPTGLFLNAPSQPIFLPSQRNAANPQHKRSAHHSLSSYLVQGTL